MSIKKSFPGTTTGEALRSAILKGFAFYDEAKTAYAIVATGEMAVYANVMLQKGVVKD